MNITDIKKQNKISTRYNIFVDDNFSFSAEIEDVAKFHITKGKEITTKELDELREKCEETKAYNYALNLIQRKDYTFNEIRTKIKDRAYSERTIEIVMDKLQKLDFIDDAKYISKYVNDSMKFKKYGRKKIIYNLENKGINRNNLKDMIFDEEVEYENACELAARKLKTINDKNNKKEKLYRFLVSKGYEYEIIKKVINNVFKEEF